MTKTSSQLNAPVLMTEPPQVLLGEIQKSEDDCHPTSNFSILMTEQSLIKHN